MWCCLSHAHISPPTLTYRKWRMFCSRKLLINHFLIWFWSVLLKFFLARIKITISYFSLCFGFQLEFNFAFFSVAAALHHKAPQPFLGASSSQQQHNKTLHCGSTATEQIPSKSAAIKALPLLMRPAHPPPLFCFIYTSPART